MRFALFCVFSVSLAVCLLLRSVGKKPAVTPDGTRFRYRKKPPRFGGVGIASGVAVGAGLFGYFADREAVTLLLPYFFFLAVGLVDDLWRLRPLAKLLLETAGAILYFSLFPSSFSVLGAVELLFLVFFVNAYNFMDGADGIAAAYAVPTLVGLAVVFVFSGNVFALVLSLAAAAGLLGFLPFDLPRAGLYMGDCGSLSVGFLIGALSLIAARDNPFALLFCLFPIADALRVVCVRASKKRKPWEGDRRHLHYLLLSRGVSSAGLFFLYLAMGLITSVVSVAAFVATL